MVYEIPAGNFEAVQVKLEKINKRAKKMGVAGFALKVVGTSVVPQSNGEVDVLYQVEIEGETPRLAGYSFVASLDHDTDGSGRSNIVSTLGGATLTETQRNLPANCEHCGKIRSRRKTYLLQKAEDKSFIQVGSSCVGDFFDGNDPTKVLELAKLWTLVEDEVQKNTGPSYEFVMNSWRNVVLPHYLAYVARSIRGQGWTSSKRAFETGITATKDSAWTDMQWQYVLDPQDKEVAEDTIEWVLKNVDKSKSDFNHNVVTLAETGYLGHKQIGVAASMVQMFLKAQSEARRPVIDFSKSQFVGTVGQKVEKLHVKVVSIVKGESYNGPWTRVTLTDDYGNLLVTFGTGKNFSPVEGTEMVITAKVKGHNVYKGTNQTMLNYVRTV